MRSLRFTARGDDADYAVLRLSSASGNEPPAMQRFRSSPEWRDHAVELSGYAGADLTRLRAIAIVALGPPGKFELIIDAVELPGAGLRSADIAERLHRSPGTVRNCLSEAIGKLGAANRLEAWPSARQKGWL